MSETSMLPTLLVVDDDPAVRSFVCETLREAGYNVLSAGDGAEALDACRRFWHPIALLLTDVEMPGMSGFNLAEKALEMRPAMKVLFMSGNGAARAGRSETFGAAILAKPFDVSSLVRNIKQILEG